MEWPSGEATVCKTVHTGSIPVSTSQNRFTGFLARLAQRESASLTRKRSLVQSQYRAPESRTDSLNKSSCGCSAVGSASPCQGEGREFESRHPLHSNLPLGAGFFISSSTPPPPSRAPAPSNPSRSLQLAFVNTSTTDHSRLAPSSKLQRLVTTTWVAGPTHPARRSHSTQQDTRAERSVHTPDQQALRTLALAALWPVALALFVHRVFILGVNGDLTDDFSTVYYALRRFHEGVEIYNENYSFVDPHYLYNPGATLLLSPLALTTHIGLARVAFIVVNALVIVVALALLTRLAGASLRGPVFPGAITAAFLTESVRNTLIFSNINGLLLLALSLFLYLLLHERVLLAGVVLGLAILVKPLFLPLIFLPLLKLQWRAVAGAIAVPALLNVVAWPFVPGASDYIFRTMPYLSLVRDYANSSLPGMAVYFGMPEWQQKLWFVVFAVVVVVAIIFVARIRYVDPFTWATTTSAILLCGVFFLSSLGQMYYSMLLFPVFFTALRTRSVVRNPVVWAAAYCFYTTDEFVPSRFPSQGEWLTALLPTVGWAAFLLACAVIALSWWYDERRSASTAA